MTWMAKGLVGLSMLAVSAAAHAQQPLIPQAGDSDFVAAKDQLLQQLAVQPNTGRARNIILFIVDGMSIPTITASRIYEGQARGVDGESNVLAFEALLPYTAFSKTYTHDAQVADSAPTATAILSGVKSLNGTIGVTQAARVDNCASQKGAEAESIFVLAEAAGLSTGVVSTARITHATPAAAYAHVAGRDWENDTDLTKEARADGCVDIARQLVDWDAGDGFEVMLGGGRGNFMPDTQVDPEVGDRGGRADGRDLIARWLGRYDDAAYVWNRAQFDAVDPDETGHLLGLFEPSHMRYEADRPADLAGEPSIANMTAKAIEILSRNDKGFVLLVEAGRVDHAHHEGNAARALVDTVAVDEAVRVAYGMVDPSETLIILTADHSHTMTMAGYPPRGNPILGIGGIGDDGLPYTTLGYANGPGAPLGEPRGDLTGIDTTAVDFVQPAQVPLGAETHGGEDVAIFAAGPWAHLFHGVMEQNLIYHVMVYASQLPALAAAAE